MNKLSRDYVNEFTDLGPFLQMYKDNQDGFEEYLNMIDTFPTYNQRYSKRELKQDNEIQKGDPRYELMNKFDKQINEINKAIIKLKKLEPRTKKFEKLVEELSIRLNYINSECFG